MNTGFEGSKVDVILLAVTSSRTRTDRGLRVRRREYINGTLTKALHGQFRYQSSRDNSPLEQKYLINPVHLAHKHIHLLSSCGIDSLYTSHVSIQRWLTQESLP